MPCQDEGAEARARSNKKSGRPCAVYRSLGVPPRAGPPRFLQSKTALQHLAAACHRRGHMRRKAKEKKRKGRAGNKAAETRLLFRAHQPRFACSAKPSAATARTIARTTHADWPSQLTHAHARTPTRRGAVKTTTGATTIPANKDTRRHEQEHTASQNCAELSHEQCRQVPVTAPRLRLAADGRCCTKQ